MTKCLLILCCFSATFLYGQDNSTWIPYSAKYSETIKDTDASGHATVQTKVGEEIRSADGSLLTTVTNNGQRVNGRLWQACGQMLSLSYDQKKAILSATAPRRHPNVPPDPPQGGMTLDGVQFTAYPVHSNIGSGTIWINLEEDITEKLEMHLQLPGGARRDTVRQLTSLDLNSAVDSSEMTIPSGFTSDKAAKAQSGCMSTTTE